MIKFRPRDTCSEQEEVVWEKEDEKTLPTRRGMTGGGGGGPGAFGRGGQACLWRRRQRLALSCAHPRSQQRRSQRPGAGDTPPVRQQTNEQAKCTTYR